MKRIETIRLYPNAAQSAALDHALHVTRHLYNALLQERRDAYRSHGIRISMKMQYAEITDLRAESIALSSVYRETEDAVLRKLDIAFSAAFSRIKRGDKAGFPRFKPAARWRQLQFPHGDRCLKFDRAQGRVTIPNVGSVKLRKGRTVPPFKRAWLVKKHDRWYAQFECEREVSALPATGTTVGIDRGVTVLLATSDGALHPNPQFVEATRLKVERAQRVVAKRKRGGKNRRKAVAKLAKLHDKIARQRRDYAHKLSRIIVNEHDVIALENLKLRNMTRSAKGTIEDPGRNVAAKAGLNRALLDAGFGQIAQLIAEKAESAAREIVYVDPKYTSQTCAACGHVASENRRGIRFSCVSCGHPDHADINAAKVILQRAQKEPSASRAAEADGNDPSTALSSSGPRLALQDVA